MLAARGAPSEVTLTYSGLADLLSGLDRAVPAELPAVQQQALDRVLMSGGFGPQIDERAVAAAFLAVLEALGAEAPVLVALDDAAWLDPASRTVIGYAARRLTGPVAVLATVRSGGADEDSSLNWLQMSRPDQLVRRAVAPMSLGGMHQMFTRRLGRTFPRPTMTRIHATSGGNPFYALELGRGLLSGTLSATALPDSLAALVRERVGGLPEASMEILLTVSAAVDQRLTAIARAAATSVEELVEILEPVESQGIIKIDGYSVRFAHPLLSAGVYGGATPAQRRAAHRRLADAVDSVELRARHLALASTGADPETLAALDAAAAVTAAQGAPATAAEILDLAMGLGGDTPMRRIVCANHHFVSGDAEVAQKLLEGAVDDLPSGTLRASALLMLGGISVYTDGFRAAERRLLQGIAETDDPALLTQLHMLLSFTAMNAAEFDVAEQQLTTAVDYVERLDSDGLRSQILTLSVMLGCLRGDGICPETRRRALELEDPQLFAPIVFRASANEMQLRSWSGDLRGATELFDLLWQHSAELGAESELLFLAVQGVQVAVWRGDLAGGTMIALDATERAEQLGGHNSRLIAAIVVAAAGAYCGRVEETRRAVAVATEIADHVCAARLKLYAVGFLGFLETSLGNYAEALEVLEPKVREFLKDPRITELHSAAFVPDAVEALLAVGRPEDAEPLVEAMEIGGARLRRPWASALGARCRAMLQAVGGDLEAAEETVRRALAEHDNLPMPFERARTLLLRGQLQRRRRHRQDAADTLAEALAVFESIGAELWAKRAREELDRLSAAVSGPEIVLTPAELRVASRAADGMSNKQIAAELFISTKTVETNLSSAYRKLGIRSRARLYSRLQELSQGNP